MGFFMNKTLIILLLLPLYSGICQKVMDKHWSSEGIDVLKIRSDEVFNIFISNSKGSDIEAVIRVEGETYENVVLEVNEKDGTLSMETAYAPYFTPHNDKLAAHKVLAIEMHVRVPSGLQLNVEAEIASLVLNGNYEFVDIGLARGNCKVIDFAGNGRIYTKEGFIDVTAKAGVSGQARSKSGNVKNNLPAYGKYRLEAESISGDITLKQTK